MAAHIFSVARKREEALRITEELEGQWTGEASPAYWLALIHTTLGRKEQALEWLEKSAQSRLGLLMIINVEPAFDSVRSEPRFQALLRKLGF